MQDHGVEEPCSGGSTPPANGPQAPGEIETSARLSPWARTVFNITMTLSACAGAYLLLQRNQAEQTALLFVGLPTLIGFLSINLMTARNGYTATIRNTLLFLCLVAPLLGEGAICIIVAAPLFLAIALLVVLACRGLGRLGRRYGLFVLLPAPLMALGDVPSESPIEIVETTTVVEGRAEDWLRAVQGSCIPPKPRAAILQVGLPLPTKYEIEDNKTSLHFETQGQPRGAWHLDRTLHSQGVAWQMRKDTSKIGHWLEIESSRVDVEAAPGPSPRTRIIHRTTFAPRLAPTAYFLPLERLAFRAAHDYAVQCWQTGT